MTRTSMPLLTLWRVVVEARSPLSIGTGRGDGVRDVVLAADANGLPMLPASALAGVLRAAVAGWHGEAAARALFGCAEGDRGQVSRVTLSHGRIHDSRDRPVAGLLPQVDDPLLRPLTQRSGTTRQRVRIDHRGVAADQGLFDRTVLPAGHRFSVELALWSGDGDVDPASGEPREAGWLQTLLCVEGLRVGAQTRSGLGEIAAVRAHRLALDLRRPADLGRWARLSPHLGETDGMAPLAVGGVPATRAGVHRIEVELAPEAGFRFGSGHHSLQAKPPAKLPDDLPRTEARVAWTGGRGRLQRADEETVLVPASSVKGALAHRVAFHAHRLNGRWADAESAREHDKSRDCDTVRRLFGHAADRGPARGQAGVLWVADARIEREHVVAQTRMHNSIDRFTGGVRDGLLFSEENLHAAGAGPLLKLALGLDRERAARVGVTATDLQALALALDDLCAGRLALGADSASGLGFFVGRWTCDGERRLPQPDMATAD
ncbi:RAMP superfamily CRISPR-associated protein [Rubrivivax benzoatilyticus]|uniref:CRISPR type III-associated protein domain-containing protein n=1 Tax=Rubrivivax benzoatilyticus TaxID=316997 RepID=A0ABX0HY23_9BURK|nr:RAMP superfamily CRISPR-associated protein [Rubrivivax benzoatilyticus]NHK99498.1 hypothetical protein [Rubrivivax benzoatilyticus]NHL25372.1 hypothetical protein [Rubrivivax benzoatilyticus]